MHIKYAFHFSNVMIQFLNNKTKFTQDQIDLSFLFDTKLIQKLRKNKSL